MYPAQEVDNLARGLLDLSKGNHVGICMFTDAGMPDASIAGSEFAAVAANGICNGSGRKESVSGCAFSNKGSGGGG